MNLSFSIEEHFILHDFVSPCMPHKVHESACLGVFAWLAERIFTVIAVAILQVQEVEILLFVKENDELLLFSIILVVARVNGSGRV